VLSAVGAGVRVVKLVADGVGEVVEAGGHGGQLKAEGNMGHHAVTSTQKAGVDGRKRYSRP
jgi:hypothetical protein